MILKLLLSVLVALVAYALYTAFVYDPFPEMFENRPENSCKCRCHANHYNGMCEYDNCEHCNPPLE